MSIWLKSNEAGLRSSWWENLRGHLERDKLRILDGIQVVAEFCLSEFCPAAPGQVSALGGTSWAIGGPQAFPLLPMILDNGQAPGLWFYPVQLLPP